MAATILMNARTQPVKAIQWSEIHVRTREIGWVMLISDMAFLSLSNREQTNCLIAC